MPYLLIGKGHKDITLSEEEAAYLLRSNDMNSSKLTAMREFGENAHLHSGAVMKWGKNVA
ncbi:hypothetical protein [Desulfovibrio gilichinskyi]|uniref:Uncharacterized protein n=1 Tax=Desulfovibrio gilichinskyi TaxID=1519643 RepID=A0A1X7C354_9BACT|nr:hypothetical protein [Desulfovibrio gilichinskyi]SME89214.1 hypothetical protein SAMN06295933_0254 [Desulfovibrio gilichinskyi]